jgi:hypothetical protein
MGLVGVLVMSLAVAVAIGAQRPPQRFDELEAKSITADEIIVRDPSGKDRILLSGGESSEISLLDSKGEQRILLTTGKSLTLFAINGPQGGARIQLGQTGGGRVLMNVLDAKRRAAEFLNDEGIPLCKECLVGR